VRKLALAHVNASKNYDYNNLIYWKLTKTSIPTNSVERIISKLSNLFGIFLATIEPLHALQNLEFWNHRNQYQKVT